MRGRTCRRRDARFNSRAHGGRDKRLPLALQIGEFQFTRPRGARLARTHMSTTRCAFQFTRPRGARQTPAACLADRRVSIHAPTGGATVRIHRPGGLQIVSIHAPTGGATVSGGRLAGSGCFNSRAHGGRDVRFQFVDDMVGVSIHAPTGGATRRAPSLPTNCRAFQFTRPRGARRLYPISLRL